MTYIRLRDLKRRRTNLTDNTMGQAIPIIFRLVDNDILNMLLSLIH